MSVSLPLDVSAKERKVYSQHGEDGVLEWLATVSGTCRKHIVEIGAEWSECNSRNLVENHGWTARLVDDKLGDFVTAENANHYVDDHTGILSIDVDGNDYWLWQAITAKPDIVCIEYSAHFGPSRKVTIPYDPNFKWQRRGHWFRGASLAALHSLGQDKGYRLVGCESSGTNCFFVCKLVGSGLPDLCPEETFVASRKAVRGEIDWDQLVSV